MKLGESLMDTKLAKRKTVSRGRKRASVRLGERDGITEVRQKWNLSRKLFSRLTGFSERAIAGWESGTPLGEPAERRIREIARLQQRLAHVVKPAQVPAWLQTPNQAFDGLKPLEVIERGEMDRLWSMIFYLESGLPS
jgi:DNA-binding transcriptional regulator YiaG